MLHILTLQATRWSILMLLGDVAAFGLALPLVCLTLQENLGSWSCLVFLDPTVIGLWLGINLFLLYVAEMYDQYQDYRVAVNISRLIFAIWLATVIGVWVFCTGHRQYLPRALVERQAMAFGVLLVAWRYLYSTLAVSVRPKSRTLIIGDGLEGRLILEAIRSHPLAGMEVVGFIGTGPDPEEQVVPGVPVLGSFSQLSGLLEEYWIERVVVALTGERHSSLLLELSRLSFNAVKLLDMRILYEQLCGKIPIEVISELWLYIQSVYQGRTYYRLFKRLMDLAGALLGLTVTLPLWGFMAAAIKLDSAGPVFFRQQRLGRDNRPFAIFKFRTMYDQAGSNGSTWTEAADPRITRVGRWLRRLRLDELPQLLNVVKGEMSLIGPRAEWNLFADEALQLVPRLCPGRRAGDRPGVMVQVGYEERIPYYGFRTVVRPGITGWAQVMFPLAGSSVEDLKEKLRYDLYYIKNMGFWLDVIILLKTIRIVVIGKGK